ncbi:FYN-binding protein 1 [Spea bombifrons]|uniref:FYN-binding protein 1 n=1 Tax=Spea bombifrons TaxID=233779 RepID=UPI0023493009|nr:FYN-binding protein 1 [Spea bombifrons]
MTARFPGPLAAKYTQIITPLLPHLTVGTIASLRSSWISFIKGPEGRIKAWHRNHLLPIAFSDENSSSEEDTGEANTNSSIQPLSETDSDNPGEGPSGTSPTTDKEETTASSPERDWWTVPETQSVSPTSTPSPSSSSSGLNAESPSFVLHPPVRDFNAMEGSGQPQSNLGRCRRNRRPPRFLTYDTIGQPTYSQDPHTCTKLINDTTINVKSLAARFNGVSSPMEDSESSPGHPALKVIQARKAGFEKNSSSVPGLLPIKPAPPKPLQGLKPAADEVKPPFAKPNVGLNRNGGSFHVSKKEMEAKSACLKPTGFKPTDLHKEEPTSQFPKPTGYKPSPWAQQENKLSDIKSKFQPAPKENEEKPIFPKPSALKALNATSVESELKPLFPKKTQPGTKPPLNANASPSENTVSKNAFVAKTFSSSLENKQSKPSKEPAEISEASSSESQPFPGVKLRPTGLKPIPSPVPKQDDEKHNDDTRPTTARDIFNKASQDNNSRFSKTQQIGQVVSAWDKSKEQKDPSEPKRKPLPPLFKLGPAPQKPPRPPKVDLGRFKNAGGNGNSKAVVTEKKSSALSAALPPPPPAAQGGPAAKQLAGPPPPSLPPRNIRPPADTTFPSDDENYDDVEGKGGSFVDDMSLESDEEFYEGLDQESIQYRKEEEAKREKREKKRLEQAKKEQKEKEKKEQEMKKRFKLTGSVEVLHQATACNDYKGGKNELTFKQGDQIEIIRVTNNPEGKWLGRMNGCYGYIKTTMVNIDYDSLRRKQSSMHRPVKHHESDQEIYDDVGEEDSFSNQSVGGGAGLFPPPPSNEDIYDGVDEGNDSSVPQDEEKTNGRTWGIFKLLKGANPKKKNVFAKSEKEDLEDNEFVLLSPFAQEGDVYDDVDSSDFPPPPPLESSLVVNSRSSTLGKSTEKDYKTLKKIEKEEKEFRKKFKYTGEIRTLSTIQVVHNLTTKKWGSKDLPLKPAESLDVIQHTNDTTLLCRNSEGKYGYVLRSNVVDDDGEIYDDIGEECIYDND